MIRVTMMYANEPGARFDLDYYTRHHRPMIENRLTPMGMSKCEVDQGLTGADSTTPAPYRLVTHLVFSSLEAYHAALAEHGDDLTSDHRHFTDIEPTVQVSRIVEPEGGS